MKRKILFWFALMASLSASAQNSKRWTLLKKDRAITWTVKENRSHTDHIEMSGKQISGIITYGVDSAGKLRLNRKLVFPLLRTIPNNTHGSLIREFKNKPELEIAVDGKVIQEYPQQFRLDGVLEVQSRTQTSLQVIRSLFPSVDKAAFIEKIELRNTGTTPLIVTVQNNFPVYHTDSAKGVYGSYTVEALAPKSFTQTILPLTGYTYQVAYSGKKKNELNYAYHADYELDKRKSYVEDLNEKLILETPNDTINQLFAFSKLRAAESIYDTKNGLMHGPGGGSYYAAIWANDQAEYANPFFPFLGDIAGNESAMNSFRMFAKYMNPEMKPIPSSIVAEGMSYWNGAGDRGDMAMIAYGASRFALARGRKDIARELLPLIKWCLDYLDTKYTSEGVIRSNSDELEGRFPAGKINLSTNTIAYGAYFSSADLFQDLNDKALAAHYRSKAEKLKLEIEKYFGAKVEGYNTYRYYEANTKLRAWICLPLVFGINSREVETIKALFSDKLWTYNGILTESGDKTFWDRATLYAFRGLFMSSQMDKYFHYFNYYSATRLLGEHVPYAVEAWPEGGQRHLSAESALYCRTVIEGLFGMQPIGLNKLKLHPALPGGWTNIKLRRVQAFDREFDVIVTRKAKVISLQIIMPDGKTTTTVWDGKSNLSFDFTTLKFE